MNDDLREYWSEDLSASLRQAMVKFDGPILSFEDKIAMWKELMTATREEVAEQLGVTVEELNEEMSSSALIEYGEHLIQTEDWEFMKAIDESHALMSEFLAFAKWMTNHMIEFLGNKTAMDIDKFLEKEDG